MTIPPHLRRLAAMHRPYKKRLALAFLAMIVTAGTESILPFLLRYLFDMGFTKTPAFSYWLVPVVLVGLFAIRGASTFSSTYEMSWVSTQVLNELRRQMFDKMLQAPVGFYAANPVGRVINTVMFEVQQIVEMVTKVFTSIARSSLTVVGLLIALFRLNWKLAIVSLILVPLIAIVVNLTGKRLKKLNQHSLVVNGQLTQVVEETTRAQQVIKIFGGEDYEKGRLQQRSEDLRRYTMRMTRTFAATVPITHLITSFALSVVVVLALVQASHGQLTVGEFMGFVTAMLLLLTPLKQLAEVNGPLQRGIAAAESVFHLVDTPTERTDGKKLESRASGKLDFIDVNFSYPGQPQRALSGINLHVKPGETIAFVGMSGGGKSTLVNLVPGFFSASSGRILLDDQSIDDIALSNLRSQIAMVSQHVVLFDDTVAANIAYGDPSPDHDRIVAAAKAAHLSSVIDQLPQGYETGIGDNGSRLSGGQRQRLAIARAIYKDAPLLILDEATSALDSESERAVQAALDQLMLGRTTLVIAHRLSTIERASRIAVLASGSIVEIGTHDELLQLKGIYANLYHLQFSGEALAMAL